MSTGHGHDHGDGDGHDGDAHRNMHLDTHFQQPGPDNDDSLAYRLEDYCRSASFIQSEFNTNQQML